MLCTDRGPNPLLATTQQKLLVNLKVCFGLSLGRHQIQNSRAISLSFAGEWAVAADRTEEKWQWSKKAPHQSCSLVKLQPHPSFEASRRVVMAVVSIQI